MNASWLAIPLVLASFAALKAGTLSAEAFNAQSASTQADSKNAAEKQKIEESAKKGDPPAMFKYANLNHSNRVEYLHWMNQAASKEYGPAILVLALEEGRLSTDKRLTREAREAHIRTYKGEMKRALEGLHAGAKSGDVESMYRIGAYAAAFDQEGLATPQECLPWLEQAAVKGHEEAPYALALSLIEFGTPIEKTKGFEWLKRATEVGTDHYRWRAAAHLVRYYSYGFPAIALKRDAKEAWKWVRKGVELQGVSLEEFLEGNGLQNPDKVEKGEILFQ